MPEILITPDPLLIKCWDCKKSFMRIYANRRYCDDCKEKRKYQKKGKKLKDTALLKEHCRTSGITQSELAHKTLSDKEKLRALAEKITNVPETVMRYNDLG